MKIQTHYLGDVKKHFTCISNQKEKYCINSLKNIYL